MLQEYYYLKRLNSQALERKSPLLQGAYVIINDLTI